MRSFLISLFLLSLLTSACFAEGLSVGLVYNTGGDLAGELGTINVTFKDPGALGVTGSYFVAVTENLELGGGLTYFMPRDITEADFDGTLVVMDEDGDYNVIPIFGRMRYIFNPGASKTVFYAGGDLRYALVSVSGDAWTGISAAGGMGFGVFGGVMFADIFEAEAGYILQYSTFDWGSPINEVQNLSEGSFYIKGSVILDALM